MRINKKNDYVYTKELDFMEKYLLNMFKRYLENDNDFLEKSVESIIYESVKRSKKEISNIPYQHGDKRPQNPKAFTPFFDTSINKAILWNGIEWIDFMGNIV